MLCDECAKQPNCLLSEIAKEDTVGFVHATQSSIFEPQQVHNVKK